MNENVTNTQQQGQPIMVDIKDTTPMVCKCGKDVFLPAVRVRKWSAILSKTGKEEILNQSILYCKECGEVFELTPQA